MNDLYKYPHSDKQEAKRAELFEKRCDRCAFGNMDQRLPRKCMTCGADEGGQL